MTQASKAPVFPGPHVQPAIAQLEVRNLTKVYGPGRPALDGISFAVQQGEFVSVIGPSGAGKSTLLRCINRMIEISSGEVLFEGTPVGGLRKRDLGRLRTKIGMIFQHYNLVDRLTVIENVLHGRLGAKSTLAGAIGLYTQEEKLHARDLLDMLGLEDQIYQRCDRLSGGQKQRVGIARALIQNPRMILCDEPIASLDPNASRIIMEQLKRFSKEFHITTVVNLHQVDVALKYSDRILGINAGRLVFDAPPADLTPARISDIYGVEARDLATPPDMRHAG